MLRPLVAGFERWPHKLSHCNRSVTGSLFAALGRRQHYSSESFENWEFKREFVRLAFAVLFSFGFALLVVFSLKESALFSRVWVLTWCASVFVILFTGQVPLVASIQGSCRKGHISGAAFF